ncbi:MASE3 domain-containing sensor histidine kinase [Garciella nitratireducens]|uniref:MASE3 domain-containing sensor histidine kinase n=1 Tax=Garciella nitratireducens TaxID=218205 RepID=UPI000DEB62EC|nr:ATP-binding protein [Garciella nitratireducens]RBP38702.1 signal transduction histidine kinase [Garciella nitratireducens]
MFNQKNIFLMKGLENPIFQKRVKSIPSIKKENSLIAMAAIAFFIFILSKYNNVFFHIMLELTSVIFGIYIIMIAISMDKLKSPFPFISLAIAYGFICFFYTVHALSYKGFNMLSNITINRNFGFFLCGNYLESITYLWIGYFINGEKEKIKKLIFFDEIVFTFTISIILFLPLEKIVFYRIYHAIICILFGSTLFFIKKNEMNIYSKEKDYFKWSCAFFLLFELCFAIFPDHYENALVHFLKLISFYFIYKMILQVKSNKVYISIYKRNMRIQKEIKKRMIMQQNLQKKEIILQKVLNSLEEGIIILDENSEIIHYNEKYVKMFEIPKKVLKKQNFKEINQYISKFFINPKEFIEYIQKGSHCHGNYSQEFSLKDGRIILKESMSFEVYNMKGWVIKTRDITQEKLEKKLEESMGEKEKQLQKNKEQTQFTLDFYTNFSHELKTPINIISAVGHILKKEIGNNSPKCQEYLQILNQNCNRLIRNINNSIDLNKMKAGYFQLNPQICNIVEVVEDITLSVVPYVEEKEIDLVFDTDVEEIITKIDINAIERILLNLLSNAIKFTGVGGQIQVVMKHMEKELEITVSDTGIGIRQDKIEHIFERYHQEDSSLKYNPRGNGIGLYLVKKLVEIQGGRIFAHSKVNEGSTFEIILPIIEVVSEKERKDSKSLCMHKLDYHEVASIELSDISSNKDINVR